MSNSEILDSNVNTNDTKISRTTNPNSTSPLAVLTDVGSDDESINIMEANKKVTFKLFDENLSKSKPRTIGNDDDDNDMPYVPFKKTDRSLATNTTSSNMFLDEIEKLLARPLICLEKLNIGDSANTTQIKQQNSNVACEQDKQQESNGSKGQKMEAVTAARNNGTAEEAPSKEKTTRKSKSIEQKDPKIAEKAHSGAKAYRKVKVPKKKDPKSIDETCCEAYRKGETLKMKDPKVIDKALCEAEVHRRVKALKTGDNGFLNKAFWKAELNQCIRAREMKDPKAFADSNWATVACQETKGLKREEPKSIHKTYWETEACQKANALKQQDPKSINEVYWEPGANRKQYREASTSKEHQFGDKTCWMPQAYQKGKENYASFTDDVQWSQRTKPLKHKHHRTTEQGAHQNSIAVETNDEREFLRARNKEKKAAIKIQQATQAPSKVENFKYKSRQGSFKAIENNCYRTYQDYSEPFMKEVQSGQEEEYEDDEYEGEEEEEKQSQTFHNHKEFKHGRISFSTSDIKRAQARLSTKFFQCNPETNDDESDTEIYPNISRSNHATFSMGRKMANDQTPYQYNCGFHNGQLEYGNGYATINYGSICLQSAYKEAVPRQTSKNIVQLNNRKNWSFSNERAREIQRHNQILMKKINGQKSPYKFKGKKGVES